MIRRYPEWFIGGPWHGKDKLKQCPNLPGPVMVASMPEELEPVSFLEPLNPVSERPFFDQIMYVSREFHMVDRTLKVWIPNEDASAVNDPNGATFRRVMSSLLDLVMLPHEISAGNPGDPRFDVEAATEEYRRQREAERQRTIAFRASLREETQNDYRRIQELSLECQRLRGEVQRLKYGADTDWRYASMSNTADAYAGQIEIVADRRWLKARYEQATVFFDQGNDEIDPSWVATAQSDQGPVTGYGTSPGAAMLAMLADALDICARMIDTSEKPRIK